MGEITGLLHLVGEGDEKARARLFEIIYDDLKRIARARLRRSPPNTLFDTSVLIHEAYLRLLDAKELEFGDRGHFFAYCAFAMRSILVDETRRRHAEIRGGGAERIDFGSLDDELVDTDRPEILQVHEALEELAKVDPRLVQVVEMRYFGGFSEAEISAAMGLHERTVRRDWVKARALLLTALKS